MPGLPVGIDLGTTHSLLAVLEDSGQVRLVEGADGSVLTPSAVGISDEGRLLVGMAAHPRRLTHPEKTQVLFKRLMGTAKELRLGSKTYKAADMAAFVLRKLKDDFDASYPNAEIEHLVVSVPAYFSSAQREATLLAAELAGLPRPRLINEPTAAALAYGLQDREGEGTFVILDLGGGTFDVSIVEMFNGVMEVRSSAGDTRLGGEDFTEVIAQRMSEHLDLDWKSISMGDAAPLMTSAEALKRRLTEAEVAETTLPVKGGVRFDLSRAEFEDACANLMIRLRRPIDQCLYDAGLTAEEIDRVILVGGATRMPMVRALVTRMLKRFPETGINPDEVVAQGAAVQAGLVARNQALSDLVMTDVAPYSLGINSRFETPSGVVENAFVPIIERSTVLPASRVRQFATVTDRQTKIDFGVFQGESPIAAENARIGSGVVKVPPGPAGAEAIDVRFSYDTSGLLHVGVTVISTGQKTEMVIEGSARHLSAHEKQRRLRELEALMAHPRDEAINIAVSERLKALYAMLLGDEREAVRELVAYFEGALSTQDPRRIAAARDEVERAAMRLEGSFVR
ncbi:Hsp70 family protein [uncultured Devosia sp.]|uniref:Hsp70 family protein n=1 Tax=uncultured Devosia sp. TaxID=211434 RepID=UPI0026291D9B|nr:Hsp70 family protein [uncultured Devosia sp.]